MTEEKHIQQPHPRDNYKPWEDPLYSDLRKIITRAKLREVLTHYSYYNKEGKGNGRYVFAGMFAFRGLVAQVLFDYVPGEGTQLQHLLGNLFKNELLAQTFDNLKLKQFVRAGEKFDVDTHKHIFVYALYGYVTTLEEDLRKWFISKFVLGGENARFLTHKKRNRDLLAQADDIVRQTDGRRLSLQMEQTEEGLYRAKAVLSDGTILCDAVSKSWRYARTKATKTALNILAIPSRKYLLSNPEYHARVLERVEAERAKRKAEIEDRDAKKAELREKRKEAWKNKIHEKDIKRRLAQAAAKKRKAENAARAAAKAAKEARPMSANKRRYLEDKQK